LATDVAALDAVQFAAGAAELAYSYAAYLMKDERPVPYSEGQFVEFEAELTRIGWNRTPAARYDAATCYRVIERMLWRRDGGYWAIGSGDLVRLELVEAWRENPSCRKILVSGVAAVGFLFSATLCGIEIHRELERPDCEQRAFQWERMELDALRQIGEFEGHLSDQKYQMMQTTLGTSLAGCGTLFSWISGSIEGYGIKAEVELATDERRSR
jgi:hypothetical protein